MMPVFALDVRIDLGSTLGVTFIGVAVSSMIYGCTCLQTFNYYRSSRAKADNAFLRALKQVALLLLCDTFHQILVLHATYHYLILGFAEPVTLSTTLIWSLPAEIIMNHRDRESSLSCSTVGTMLIMWAVSQHVYLAVCAVCAAFYIFEHGGLTTSKALLTVANIAVNLAYGIRGSLYHNLFEAAKALQIHGTIGLSISLATDLFISLSLCYYLHQSRTGLRGYVGSPSAPAQR
uniref:Spa2 n=1 Tax=Ganoderma boninense TaxID=34458 RepID=A0A5K1JUJ2_9APHY|nr:Spa2 [Ganoderma boninense]